MIAMLVAAVALAHAPFVRSRVRGLVVERLRADAGIDAVIDRLDYNLLALRLSVGTTTLAAAGNPTPFLTLDGIDVDLPWSIVSGRIAVESLTIARPVFTITRDADGQLNLPASEPASPEPAPAALGPIDIGALTIRDLAVDYRDQPLGLSVDGRAVTLALARGAGGPLAGRLTMRGGIEIAAGTRTTTVSQLEGDFSFDGSTLAFDGLRVEAPELALQLDGRVELLAAAPRVDTRYEGRLRLGPFVPWVAPEEAVSGEVAFSGTVEGALDAPNVALAVAAQDLAWRDQRGMSLALQVALSSSEAAIEQLRLTVGGGTVEGRGRVGLTDDATSHVEVTWTGLDLGGLAVTAGITEPRIATVATGRASADWAGTDVAAATAAIDTSLSTGRAPAAAVALSGRLAAALTGGQWTATLDRVATRTLEITGRATGRLNADDVSATTLGGNVRAVVDDLPAFLAELRAAGLVLADTSSLAGGRASLEIALAGTVGAPSATGVVDAGDLEIEGVGPGTLTAAFAADPAMVAVKTFDFSLAPNTMSGQVVIDLNAGTLQGALTADLPRLSPLMAMLPPESRVEGAATLSADIGGTLNAPAVQVVAGARDLALAGQRFDRVDLEARLAGQVLVIERLDVAQGPGRLDVTARYDLDDGRYTFTATGRDLAVQPVVTTGEPLPVAARFDLDLSGDGTLDAPAGRGTIAVRDLTWGDYALGAARVEATVAEQQAKVTAAMPALSATLELSAALAGDRNFTADVALRETDLDVLLRPTGPAGSTDADALAAPMPLTGAITATATARGALDRPADAVVELDVRLVDVAAGGVPIRLDRPAKLRYEAGRIVAEDVSLQSGAMTLTALGRFGDAADTEGLTVSLKGGMADLLPFAHLVEGLEELEASGSLDLTVHAAGALEAPRVEATLAVVDVSATVPDMPPVTGVQLQAGFTGGLLTLTEFGATWQGGTVKATGTVPVTLLGESLPAGYLASLPSLPDRAAATIRLDSVTAAMAAPFVDAATLAQVEGALAATITVEATSLAPESVTAAVTLDRAELLIAGEPLKQDRPTRLRLADGQFDIVDWTWSGKGNSLAISGGARLLGDRPELNAALRGTLDLRMLGVASPDVAAGGRADFDIRAAGPLDDPAIDGEVTLRDGELAMRDPRLAVTDLVGVIALTKDRIRFVDFRASANGGTMQLSGEVTLDAFVPAGGAIEIQGRGLAVEMPENLRSEVDLDLTLTVDAESPELAGTVTVLRGSYRAPVSLAGQLVAGVTVAAVPVEPSVLDAMRFNINVVSQDGIIVDNNYGKLELDTDLRVVGTYLLPVLAGRMTIAEGGAVFLGGQTWALERGTVDFTSATEILPNLDLSLVTRVQQYDIRLSVTGTPDTLEANLSSPDGISQADAVSLLLTGKVADRQSVAQSEIARGQLLLLLSGELLGFAGRAVGLDSAQVGRGLGSAGSSFDLLATDSDPSARLTVSKQLRRDVELVFSRSLRDSSDLTWIAIYRPLKAIELRATTLDDNGRSYEFRNELNFGGGDDASRTTTARPPSPRVSAVRWTGAAGFAEDELRGHVKLEEGNRFDFFRWQQDRDRLAGWYHDRGYLEARIRATRATVPATSAVGAAGATGAEPSVELTYAIERGPATSIVVEGVDVPSGVLADMREAWASALFDGFLRDDVEALVAQWLAGDGYLQAEAEAVIREDAAAGTKQVALSVTPGPKYAERRIVFEGQQTLSSGALMSVVETNRLTLTAWRRPAEVETALTAHYRSLGFQQAAVSIGAPVFAGDVATLPVTVREGPHFQIASVDITGVAAASLERVQKAFGITAGTPYVPSTLEAARRAVEVDYLQAGYNDVRVTLTSVADVEQPSTHLTLDVREGARQVLADVAVNGAQATTRGTVDTALNLTIGEPASLSESYRAQKRLYDTGIFRRADVDLVPMGEAAADGTQPVRAVVTLAEVPKYRLRYGLRLIDDLGPLEGKREIRPGFVVDFLRRNLFGRALSAGAAGQLERDRRLARGILSTPQLFGLPVTTNLFLTQSRQEFTASDITPFVRDGSEVVAEQRFNPRSNMTVAYNYRFLRTHAFQIDLTPDDVPFDLRVDVARLTGTVARDTRDDPFDTRRGWFQSSGIEFATPSLGSDLRFLKFILQQFYFKPIGERIVLASAMRLGTAWGYEAPLLFSERYFAGGGTSVRGFAENGLGGLDYFGDPMGGASSVVLNQELRFPIYKWVRGVGFVDAGNVFPRLGELSLSDLEYGAGFGLRIETPFGLARIDYGLPLTGRSGQPFGRWYFSLGQAF